MYREIITPDNFDPSTIHLAESDYSAWLKAMKHTDSNDQFELEKEVADIIVGKHLIDIITRKERYGDEPGEFDRIPTGKYKVNKLGKIWLEYKKGQVADKHTETWKWVLPLVVSAISLIISLVVMLSEKLPTK